MIVAVTGGTGFVGQHILSALQERGVSVRMLVHTAPSTYKIPIFIGDTVTGQGLEPFLSGADVLINLIGRYKPPFRLQYDLNVLSVYHLLQAAAQAKIKKVIHMSSSAVYGSADKKSFRENDLLLPNTTYGLSKKSGEDIVEYFHRVYDLPYVMLRPTNIYGNGMSQGVIFGMIESLRSSGTIVVYGDGEQVRDFVHVTDVTQLIMEALSGTDTQNGIYNVSGEEAVTLNELAHTLQRIAGRDIMIRNTDVTDDSLRVLRSDSSKARRIFRWQPQVTLEKGLRELVLHTRP